MIDDFKVIRDTSIIAHSVLRLTLKVSTMSNKVRVVSVPNKIWDVCDDKVTKDFAELPPKVERAKAKNNKFACAPNIGPEEPGFPIKKNKGSEFELENLKDEQNNNIIKDSAKQPTN